MPCLTSLSGMIGSPCAEAAATGTSRAATVAARIRPRTTVASLAFRGHPANGCGGRRGGASGRATLLGLVPAHPLAHGVVRDAVLAADGGVVRARQFPHELV